jgi:hypothetical protein
LICIWTCNPVIIRATEKVKGTKEYAKYEACIAKKRKTTELWTKVNKHSTEIPKADRISCLEFEVQLNYTRLTKFLMRNWFQCPRQKPQMKQLRFMPPLAAEPI